MTRTVDDYVDVAIGVLMTAMLLIMGVWCWRYLNDLYSEPVLEKTAPVVQWQERAPEHTYTGRDLFLELVVNDEFCPEPAKVVFNYNGKSCTIEYDSEWFSNKETNISTKWTEFFMHAVNAKNATFELEYDASHNPTNWLVTLTDT